MAITMDTVMTMVTATVTAMITVMVTAILINIKGKHLEGTYTLPGLALSHLVKQGEIFIYMKSV